MMKKIAGSMIVAAVLAVGAGAGESNVSKESNASNESNVSKKESIAEAQIRMQIEREKKYAKEQTFYQGDEYDLKSREVDPETIKHTPSIEPDYDFDITDVYRDDI